jgi:hypothetical protein
MKRDFAMLTTHGIVADVVQAAASHFRSDWIGTEAHFFV